MKINKIIGISVVLLLIASVIVSASLTSFASANVSYKGQSEKFIFTPGSEYSPTDLFTEFKGVLPGDKLTDEIEVKNEAEGVKVKIYMRSLGADEDSTDFLSQLTLTVESKDSELFNETSDKPAQLTDWVELGTFESGQSATLDLTLNVPKDLDNKYQDSIGRLTWEFKVEEIPEETTETTTATETTAATTTAATTTAVTTTAKTTAATTAKKSSTPATGDVINTNTYVIVLALSAIAIVTTVAVIVYNNRKKKEK